MAARKASRRILAFSAVTVNLCFISAGAFREVATGLPQEFYGQENPQRDHGESDYLRRSEAAHKIRMIAPEKFIHKTQDAISENIYTHGETAFGFAHQKE